MRQRLWHKKQKNPTQQLFTHIWRYCCAQIEQHDQAVVKHIDCSNTTIIFGWVWFGQTAGTQPERSVVELANFRWRRPRYFHSISHTETLTPIWTNWKPNAFLVKGQFAVPKHFLPLSAWRLGKHVLI